MAASSSQAQDIVLDKSFLPLCDGYPTTLPLLTSCDDLSDDEKAPSSGQERSLVIHTNGYCLCLSLGRVWSQRKTGDMKMWLPECAAEVWEILMLDMLAFGAQPVGWVLKPGQEKAFLATLEKTLDDLLNRQAQEERALENQKE